MLRQSLSSKRASALGLPLAYLVSHTKIPLLFRLLAILSPYVVVLIYLVHGTDFQPWRRELIQEIRTRLSEHEVGLDLKPLMGWIDSFSLFS